MVSHHKNTPVDYQCYSLTVCFTVILFILLQSDSQDLVKETYANTSIQTIIHPNPGKLDPVIHYSLNGNWCDPASYCTFMNANNLKLCSYSMFNHIILSAENKLHACSQKRVVQTPPVPSFASDICTDSSAHNLVLLPGGESSSPAAHRPRDKPRRSTHSAGATYSQHAFKTPTPAGKYGNINIMQLWNLFYFVILDLQFLHLILKQCTWILFIM